MRIPKKITIWVLSFFLFFWEIGCQTGQVATLKQSAAKGDIDAQVQLGRKYAIGDDLEQNYEEARKWFEKAASQGDARAQNSLGIIYYNGYGVASDRSKSLAWYKKAAAQGLMEAQYNLGAMYDKGDGVVQDHDKAVQWYTKAAMQGYVEAQLDLSWKYANGDGIPTDMVNACVWIIVAADGKDEHTKMRDITCSYLDEKETSQAYKKALELLGGNHPEITKPKE